MSINYSEWPIEKGQVENLLLDPLNPRLSELNNPTQEEVIEKLIKYSLGGYQILRGKLGHIRLITL